MPFLEKTKQRRNEVENARQEREAVRQQLTEKRNEILEKMLQRRKELEKTKQGREKWVTNFASTFNLNSYLR